MFGKRILKKPRTQHSGTHIIDAYLKNVFGDKWQIMWWLKRVAQTKIRLMGSEDLMPSGEQNQRTQINLNGFKLINVNK